jgi:hypothetical protein
MVSAVRASSYRAYLPETLKRLCFNFSIRWRLALGHGTGCVCDHLAASLVKDHVFTSSATRQFFNPDSSCIHIAYRFNPNHGNSFDFENVVAGSGHFGATPILFYKISTSAKAIMLPQCQRHGEDE